MKYEEYKDSGVEWIGEVPSHWEVCRFKDFTSLLTLASHDENKIGLENIEGKTGRYIESSSEFEGDGVGFDIGDILYGKLRPYLQKVWIATFAGNAVGDFFVFRPIEICNNIYLFYVMLSDGFTAMCNSATIGAKMPRVSSDFIRGLHFFLPPLSEQQAIADYLDAKCREINRAIDVQRKKIDLLNELKQTVITDAVTKGLNPNAPMKDSGVKWIGEVPEHWEVRKLKYLCRQEKYSIKTGPFGSQLKGEDLKEEGDVRVYNQRNVLDNNFEDTKYFVTSNKAKLLKSFYTLPNDILLTSRGTIGKAALLPKGKIMGLLHPCLIAIRINKCIINPHYLLYYINEFKGFNTAIQLASNSTTIEVIYTDTIKNVLITLPSIQEQQAIVAHIEKEVSKIDTQISKANRKIELLDELKQSIITEAVTGKIKVFN